MHFLWTSFNFLWQWQLISLCKTSTKSKLIAIVTAASFAGPSLCRFHALSSNHFFFWLSEGGCHKVVAKLGIIFLF